MASETTSLDTQKPDNCNGDSVASDIDPAFLKALGLIKKADFVPVVVVTRPYMFRRVRSKPARFRDTSK